MDLVERVRETSVGEDRLQHSLDDDVRKPAVQSRMLEHVEHEQDALTSRLRTNQMLQLLCTSPASTSSQQPVFHVNPGHPIPPRFPPLLLLEKNLS